MTMGPLCPRICPILCLVVLSLVAAPAAWAVPYGLAGYSGNPTTNGGAICSACHYGGLHPVVTINGPHRVVAGETNTYSLTISGGQKIGGGLDVSASAGALAVIDPGTWLVQGEITHTVPRHVDAQGIVTFYFNWTAPLTAGQATLYGAGNSVNLNGFLSRDRPNKAQLDVLIDPAQP
jgi:hypothetical protein